MSKISKLNGKQFVVIGEFKNYTTKEISKKIESLGGEIREAVTGATHLVIAGEEPGFKVIVAQGLDVEVIDEAEAGKRFF